VRQNCLSLGTRPFSRALSYGRRLADSICGGPEYITLRFFGQVDSVANNEIYGWAFNADKPLEPVKVTLYINNRRAAEALAVYYRSDVAESMNSSGQQGFYFDLTRCCERAGDIIFDVRLPNGEVLEGTPIRVDVPACDRSSCPTLLFMHIPKTAGTAFREAALANYKQSEVAYIYADPPGFPLYLEDLPMEQRARFRFVAGHLVYGMHDWIPNDCCYFTILREPLSRIWSAYNHLIEQHNKLVFAADDRIRSLEEMFENRIAAELDNLVVRYFSGVDGRSFPVGTVDREVYELAVLHLEQAFPYVGMQERLEDAYAYLRNRLGWKQGTPPQIMNAATYSSTGRRSSAEEKLMRHFNKWDIMLYEHIGRRAQAS
jgi:galactose-3-O-sulfotransferase